MVVDTTDMSKKKCKPKRTVGPRVTLDDERCIYAQDVFAPEVTKDDVLGFVDREFINSTCFLVRNSRIIILLTPLIFAQ